MLDNAMRILISHQEMERLVTQAQDAEHASYQRLRPGPPSAASA